MTVKQIGIRLKAEGEAEVQRGGKVVGDALENAYDRGARAAAEATAAAEVQESSLRKAAAAASNLSAAEEKARQRAMRSDEAKANALRGLLDPAFAAQQKLNAELAEYAALADRGVISTKELAQAQTLARARFDETSEAIKRHGNVVSLAQARYAKMNLFRQGADVFTTGAMGMNPAMIIIQQAPQILEAIADGGFKVSRSMAVAGGAVVGVASAVAILTAAWIGNERAQSNFEKALYGSGRSLNLTGRDLEAMAVRAAKAGEISVSAAREIELQFIRTGRIQAPILENLTALTKDYAAAMGMDLADAAADLATKFARPKEGAHQLNSALGILDRTTANHIDKLVKQGRLLDAQKALFAALKPAIEGAADETDSWSKAWDEVARAAKDAWTWVGKAVDRMVGFDVDDATKLSRLRGDLARAKAGTVIDDTGGGRSAASIEKEIAEIKARLDRARTREEVAKQAATNMAREDALRDKKTATGPTAAEKIRAGEEAIIAAQDAKWAALRGSTTNLNVLLALQQREIENEREKANSELRDRAKRGEIDKARAEQAIAINDYTAAVKRAAALEATELAIDEGHRATRRELESLRDNIGRLEIERTTSLRGQMAIQREALMSRQFQDRDDLNIELDRALKARLIEQSDVDLRKEALLTGQALERDALYNPIRDNAKAALLDALDAARGGATSFAQFLGDQLERKAVKRLIDGLSEAWTTFMKNGGAGDGWMGKAVAFAGDILGLDGHANGTSYAAPGLKWVGEKGPELMRFGGGERVWSHQDSMAMMRNASRPQTVVSPVFAPVYNITGSGPEIDALRAQMAQDQASFEGRVVAAVHQAQEDLVLR